MTALDDIRAALTAAPKPKRGHERAVLVGISAERAISHHGEFEAGGFVPPETILGVDVIATKEFDGWAIRVVDKAGRWHDVEAVA